jgi:hypothetical protein
MQRDRSNPKSTSKIKGAGNGCRLRDTRQPALIDSNQSLT